MDLITQAALGAVVGELVLGRKLGRAAIGWGVLFGVVPDLDWLLSLFVDTKWALRIHPGLSHSLLVILLFTYLLAKPLAKRWKKQKVTPKEAGLFVFLAWSTHVLIDCFTTCGAQVLWPFSGVPLSFDNLFVIDPLLTLPLLVAMIWGLFIKPKEWKKGKGGRMSAICLGLASCYVGLSFLAKHRVASDFERDLQRRGLKWERMMEVPAPFGILLWRGLVERNGEIWMGYRSLFDGDEPILWTIYPKGEETLEVWRDNAEVATVRQFSKDWCLARPTPKGVWIVDLRFGEFREWDKRGLELRPRYAWEYQSEGRGDPLKKTHKVDRDTGPMMRRMWARIGGDEEDWGLKPRLIGNPAVMQEYLSTVR